MNRIGLFGGTFAPFHRGHRQALEAFLDRAALDRCVVMPAGIPPHKTKTELFSDEERFQTALRACHDRDNVLVSDWEILKKTRSYTCETLVWLQEQFPRDRLVLYVGSDMLLTLQEWRRPQDIFDRAEIAAFSRRGDDLDQLQKHKRFLEQQYKWVDCTVYTEPPFPVSSTEIREKWIRGEDVSSLLPPAVHEYLTLLRKERFP